LRARAQARSPATKTTTSSKVSKHQQCRHSPSALQHKEEGRQVLVSLSQPPPDTVRPVHSNLHHLSSMAFSTHLPPRCFVATGVFAFRL
jgi:hypothetical protein